MKPTLVLQKTSTERLFRLRQGLETASFFVPRADGVFLQSASDTLDEEIIRRGAVPIWEPRL